MAALDNDKSTVNVTSLRQLSRDYALGKLTFEEYRRARARLLDGIASGELALRRFEPPPPSLAAQVVKQRGLSDTDPTLRIRRPARARGWWIIALALVLTLAFLAAVLA